MKRRLPVLISALLIGFFCRGQINYADIYDTHFTSHASRYFPGMLGTNSDIYNFDFVNGYAWAGNTSVPYKYLQDIIFGSEITEDQVKNVLNHLNNKNNIFFGADIQALNFGFKILNKDKQELFSMQVGHRERIMGNFQFSKNLLSLLLEGNKQFAGQTISLTPVKINAIYMREFPIGASVPFPVEAGEHTLIIRPGVTAKFIMGLANIYTPRGNATLYTEPEGRYLNFDYNYLLNSSVPTSSSDITSALGKGAGYGGAADLGINFTIDDNILIDVGFIDAGAIRFSRTVNNYSNNTNYRFDGVTADLFPEGNNTIAFDFNSDVLNPVQTHNAYTTPIGAKFTLRGEYALGKCNMLKDTLNTYFQHHVFLTYVQGVQNMYNATTMPNFSLGYMYSLKNILNVGLSVGFLGYNKFSCGPFVSVKGGPFEIGFGSNNLMAFIAPKAGTGADAYVNIAFAFGKVKGKRTPASHASRNDSPPIIAKSNEDTIKTVAVAPVVTKPVVVDTVKKAPVEKKPVVLNTAKTDTQKVVKEVKPVDANVAKTTAPKDTTADKKKVTAPAVTKTEPLAEEPPTPEVKNPAPVKETKPEPVKPKEVVAEKKEAGITFRIQLIVLKGPYKESDKAAKIFGEVSSEQIANGLIRYYGGNVKTYAEAQKLLQTASANGYAGAFIVGIKNGARISNDELKAAQK